MTGHISKEISLMRVNDSPILNEGTNNSKLQPFPRTLGRFFKRILVDIREKQYDLVKAYVGDLLDFTETINYKTRGTGKFHAFGDSGVIFWHRRQ